MWTVVEKDNWRMEIYGDNLYGILLTNIDTGELYIGCCDDSIHYSRFVLSRGFTTTKHDIYCLIKPHVGKSIYVKKIESYEDEIMEMLKLNREEYLEQEQYFANKKKMMRDLDEAMEIFNIGPTRKLSVDDWIIKCYGDAVFTLEKNNRTYIGTSFYANWEDEIKISQSMFHIRINVGGYKTSVEYCIDEIEFMSSLYASTSSELCNNKYTLESKKRIKKLESILSNISTAVLM